MTILVSHNAVHFFLPATYKLTTSSSILGSLVKATQANMTGGVVLANFIDDSCELLYGYQQAGAIAAVLTDAMSGTLWSKTLLHVPKVTIFFL